MTVFPPEENQNVNPQPEQNTGNPPLNAPQQSADHQQNQSDGGQPPQGQSYGYQAPPQGQNFGYQMPPQYGYYGTPYVPAAPSPKKQLKKAIRSDVGRVIGLVFIFELIMQGLASVAVMAYLMLSEITGYAFSQPVYDFVFSYLPVVVCESGALIIGLLWFKTDVKQLFRKPTIAKGEGWKVPAYTGLSLGMIQIGSLIYMLYYYLFNTLFHIEITVSDFTMDTSNMVINVLCFAYVVVFGPLLEELFFRGILFQKVRKYGDVPAIFLTAILFALFHMNFVQLPGPLLFGIAIGIVFSKTNSLWLCWMIHALNNFLAVLYDYLPDQAVEIYSTVSTWALIAIGIVCFFLLLKDIIGVFKNRRGNCTVLSCGAKFGAMLNNVWFYLFLAFWFIMSMLTQVMS